MRRVLTAALAGAAMAWALPAAAQETRILVEEGAENLIEVGVAAGLPSGLSAKYWTGKSNAWQGTFAWNIGTDGWAASGDYLVHTRSLTQESGVKLPVYAGLGARLVSYENGDETTIGPRVPLGVEALLEEIPVSFFAEVAPAIEIGRGDPDIVADATVGARLVF